MNKNTETLTEKISFLKEARLQLLRLHKLLVDIERREFEQGNGQVSSGQFLNLLLNEPAFQWLKKFSTLIVEIDEMLDLDDGFTVNMIEKHISQLRNLINLDLADKEFRNKYKKYIKTDSEIAAKHMELKNLLSKK